MGNIVEKVLPNYEQVAELLQQSQAAASTSECHGLLCGLLCSGKQLTNSPAQWARSVMAEMAGQITQDAVQSNVLVDLFAVTKSKIENMDFDFQILLPHDDVDIAQRAEELGCWCQGFMAGLGLGGFQWDNDDPDSEIGEALNCIAGIANIDHMNLGMSEDDEAAYMEVTEYLRLAVLSIYAERVGETKGGTRLH